LRFKAVNTLLAVQEKTAEEQKKNEGRKFHVGADGEITKTGVTILLRE
jgi:hypothetical protein